MRIPQFSACRVVRSRMKRVKECEIKFQVAIGAFKTSIELTCNHLRFVLLSFYNFRAPKMSRSQLAVNRLNDATFWLVIAIINSNVLSSRTEYIKWDGDDRDERKNNGNRNLYWPKQVSTLRKILLPRHSQFFDLLSLRCVYYLSFTDV